MFADLSGAHPHGGTQAGGSSQAFRTAAWVTLFLCGRNDDDGAHRRPVSPVFRQRGGSFGLRFVGNLDVVFDRDRAVLFCQTRRDAFVLNHAGLTVECRYAIPDRSREMLGIDFGFREGESDIVFDLRIRMRVAGAALAAVFGRGAPVTGLATDAAWLSPANRTAAASAEKSLFTLTQHYTENVQVPLPLVKTKE